MLTVGRIIYFPPSLFSPFLPLTYVGSPTDQEFSSTQQRTSGKCFSSGHSAVRNFVFVHLKRAIPFVNILFFHPFSITLDTPQNREHMKGADTSTWTPLPLVAKSVASSLFFGTVEKLLLNFSPPSSLPSTHFLHLPPPVCCTSGWTATLLRPARWPSSSPRALRRKWLLSESAKS